MLFGSALVGEVESIRYIADDVAVLHGSGSVLVAWRSQLPKRRLTRNTLVAVGGPEGWRFTAIHNGRVRPCADPRARLSSRTIRPRPGCTCCQGGHRLGSKGPQCAASNVSGQKPHKIRRPAPCCS